MWKITCNKTTVDPFEGLFSSIINRSESTPNQLICFRSKSCGASVSPYCLEVDGKKIGIISEIFIIDGDPIVIPRREDGEPASSAAWRLHGVTSDNEKETLGATAVKEVHIKFEGLPWWSLKRPSFGSIPEFPRHGETGAYWLEYGKEYAGSHVRLEERWRASYGGDDLPEEARESSYAVFELLDSINL